MKFFEVWTWNKEENPNTRLWIKPSTISYIQRYKHYSGKHLADIHFLDPHLKPVTVSSIKIVDLKRVINDLSDFFEEEK
jgi:hypothetical protein